jgi:hypothetical protein
MPAALTRAQVLARSWKVWVVTTWPKKDLAVSRLWLYRCTPRPASLSAWAGVRIPSEQATWMPTSSVIARTAVATWDISR